MTSSPWRRIAAWNGTTSLRWRPIRCGPIGAHSITHAMLSSLKRDHGVRYELQRSKRVIEQHLDVVVDHLAFPYGDTEAAGAREFRIASEVGFRSAVTTQPGMITSHSGASPTSLPRLSVNGLWQDRRYLEVLLTGAPFAVLNGTRKLAHIGRGLTLSDRPAIPIRGSANRVIIAEELRKPGRI